MSKKEMTTGNVPAKQGFYRVVTEQDASGSLVAEWREYDKKQGKCWWLHVGAEPTSVKQPVPLDGVLRFVAATNTERDVALSRELTVDEKIEKAYESCLTNLCLYPKFDRPIPARRQVKVGDRLVVGNLNDPTVVSVKEDGRIIVYSHRHIEHNYGRPIDHGIAYRASLWFDVAPEAVTRTGLAKESVLHGAFRNSTLSSITSMVVNGVDDSPDYQRGYAWTPDDQTAYLESLFMGRELGRFIFVRYPYPATTAVLDGKQRLNCLMQFFGSEIAYKGTYFHELDRHDAHLVGERSVQFAILAGGEHSRADLLTLFLEVNAAGVPQSQEHLAKVRALLAREQAREILAAVSSTSKVADVYDGSEHVRSAIAALYPGFEYPDHSHRTMAEFIRLIDSLAAARG